MVRCGVVVRCVVVRRCGVVVVVWRCGVAVCGAVWWCGVWCGGVVVRCVVQVRCGVVVWWCGGRRSCSASDLSDSSDLSDLSDTGTPAMRPREPPPLLTVGGGYRPPLGGTLA